MLEKIIMNKKKYILSSFIIAGIIFIFLWFFHHPSTTFRIEGHLEGDQAVMVIVGKSNKPSPDLPDGVASIKSKRLIIYGTKMVSKSPKGGMITLSPNQTDHVAMFDLKETTDVKLNFYASQTISFFVNDESPEIQVDDFADEAYKKLKDSLIYRKRNYDIGIVFFDGPPSYPIWEAINKSDSATSLLNYVGYKGFYEQIKDHSRFDNSIISGYMTAPTIWNDGIPIYTEMSGYPITYNHETGVMSHFEIHPKINLKTKHNSNHIGIPVSRVWINTLSGSIYIGREKFDIMNSDIQIHSIHNGNLKFEQKDKSISIIGSSDEILVDGKNITNNWEAYFSIQNPLTFNIIVAMLGGFIIALITTKGKILKEWFEK